MWLPEPAPAVPAVGGDGCAFSHARNSFSDVRRHRVLADDDHRVARQQRNRFEIGDEVVAELVDRAVGDVGAEMAEADRVAVRRRAHRAADADRTARPRDVLDQHLLAERGLHALGENPRHRIRRTAGGERHDDGDGTRWKVLRGRGAAECQHCKRGQNHSSHHDLLKRLAPSLRGAKRRSNPYFRRSEMDCFATLAMTVATASRSRSA